MPDEFLVAFQRQRSNAKLRGILWELPYWEWRQIWQDSGHWDDRGRRKGQWCMGRNGDRGPYAADNVAIICVETNNREAQRTRLGRSKVPGGPRVPSGALARASEAPGPGAGHSGEDRA